MNDSLCFCNLPAQGELSEPAIQSNRNRNITRICPCSHYPNDFFLAVIIKARSSVYQITRVNDLEFISILRIITCRGSMDVNLKQVMMYRWFEFTCWLIYHYLKIC